MIPAEIYKHGGPQLMDHQTVLYQEMWRQGQLKRDFKDATAVQVYKRKVHRWQGIRSHPPQPSEQPSGTRSPAGKTVRHPPSSWDHRHVIPARKLQEKCQEMQPHLYSALVNLAKAFNTANREGVQKIV
ncbi:hypothetical protein SprV_0200711500 [Sparganum proliferum]